METIRRYIGVFTLFFFCGCGGFQSVQDLPRIEVPADLKEAETLKSKPIKIGQKKTIHFFETEKVKARAKQFSQTQAFRVGEKATLTFTWFSIRGGDVTMEVRPFETIKGRKSYHFVGTAKSSSAMDLIHSIDDWIESYVDWETFYPFKSALHGIETDRMREGLTLFDYGRSQIEYWMKRVHVKKGAKEKRRTDPLEPGILDMFSSAFFLRALPLKVGGKYKSIVYNEGKKFLIEAEVLRKEKLETEVGEFNTLVIRPIARFEGILQTSGDSTIWVTDDPRHFILRLETKIKIGYLVGKIKKIEDPEYKLPNLKKE